MPFIHKKQNIQDVRKSINTNYELHLKILTPLHVGGASEKHWKEDVDFWYEDNSVHEINQEKLFDALKGKGVNVRHELSTFILNPTDFKEFALQKLKIKLNDVKGSTFKIKYRPNSKQDIKRFIRGGLGNAFIPGSSLKGSLRSVLWHTIFEKDKSAYPSKFRNTRNIDKTTINNEFGDITTNLMRLLRVSDIEATEETVLFTTKILSRIGQTASWKHQRSGSISAIDTGKFATPYECLDINSILSFRLDFADLLNEIIANAEETRLEKVANTPANQLKDSDEKTLLPPNLDKVFNTNNDLLVSLFGLINTYTKRHINREIAFFKHQGNSETPTIINQLEKLLLDIPNDDSSCVLRLASGSGFHGITGDWQHEDHTKPLSNNDPYRRKTRRIALGGEDENGWILYPMGFVKLYLPSEEQKSAFERKIFESKNFKKQELQNIQDSKIASQASRLEEIAKQKAEIEQEKQPQYSGKPPRRGDSVDAILVYIDRMNPKLKKFKLLIGKEGDKKEQTVQLNYNADLPLNSVHVVSIGGMQKEQVQSIIYEKFKSES